MTAVVSEAGARIVECEHPLSSRQWRSTADRDVQSCQRCGLVISDSKPPKPDHTQVIIVTGDALGRVSK
jgi:hypothetical protein